MFDIRLNVILMSFSWLASSFNYYMVAFLLKYFPGNVYINSAVSALSEVAAIMLSGLLYEKLGVKKSFILSYGIAVIGGIGIIVFEYSNHFFQTTTTVVGGLLFPTLVLLAKFGISAAFTINYLCNLDLFPVLFASTAYGFCNFLARGFTILSPQVAEIQSLLPMLLFTFFSLVAMLTSTCLRVIPQRQEAKLKI